MTSDSTPAFEIEKEALKTEIETGITATRRAAPYRPAD